MKVLVCMMGDYSDSNGGSIWNANFLQSLVAIDGVEFCVMSIGPEEVGADNRKFVEALGFRFLFIAYKNVGQRSARSKGSKGRTLVSSLADRYCFGLERFSRGQTHIDGEFIRCARAVDPDLILIVYLFTTLLIPSAFKLGVPVCMITVNNELEFQRCLRRLSTDFEKRTHWAAAAAWVEQSLDWLSNQRLMRFERDIYGACAGLAALSPYDIPKNLPLNVERQTLYTLPSLSLCRWRYKATRSLFFVGNIAHFPNRLAIAWICQSFAPALYLMNPSIAVTVIGAEVGQVECTSKNVRFLGRSTPEEVDRNMTSCDLFLAPIENMFGAKLKLAKCVSFGTPFLATSGALSGLAFLSSVPTIQLDEPELAARLAMFYIDNPAELRVLSETVRLQSKAQVERWPDTCRDFLRRSAIAFQARQGAIDEH